jgi:hypothetical protein
MVPFRNFGMRKNCVVAACYSSGKITRNAMVCGIVSFSITGRIVLVLPIAILGYAIPLGV